jgi:hypothetical protein
VISLQECRSEQCDARLILKTQDQLLVRRAIEGAGLTPWAAGVLPKVVHDTYFLGEAERPWKEGQIRYQCVSLNAGSGCRMSDCPMVTVTLSVIDVASDREVLRAQGAIALRQCKLMRISEEAREQGGVLTQEDLGVLLGCDERTIRRDIKDLRVKEINIPTRGFLHDIGPTKTHKAQAIRHWLRGKEPTAIARAINHSISAVERYLDGFKRVSFCTIKGMDEVAITRITNISAPLVKIYQEMYQEAQNNPAYKYRFDELIKLQALESDTKSQQTLTKNDSEKKGAL